MDKKTKISSELDNLRESKSYKQLFNSTSNVHSYQTRSSTNNNFYIHFSKTNLLKSSLISRSGARLWDAIPPHFIKDLNKKLSIL